MEFERNVSLAPHTTFRIGGPADFFCTARSVEELVSAVTLAQREGLPIFVLGGGSNVLVADEGFRGLVVTLGNRGVERVAEDELSVTLRLAAGEPWDNVVDLAVRNGWWGVENLSHIPGSCGAFAVQNVGAYGQEASQVVSSVEVYDRVLAKTRTLRSDQCEFSYRASTFNGDQKGRYVILHTTIRLSKEPAPNLSYGDVQRFFHERGVKHPTGAEVRQAITVIRDRKFPYPRGPIGGNAGSFFRGKLLTLADLERIRATVQERFGLAAAERLGAMEDRLKVSQGYKTPTAYLLELLGLKGFRLGGAEVNEPQPSIVVNATGHATAADVLALAAHVRARVLDTFGITLEIEPELVGFTVPHEP